MSAASTTTGKTGKRTRAYSVEEAERLSRRFPLERKYSPIEAAFAAAQYLHPEPGYWLEQASLEGLFVGDGVASRSGSLTERCQFLPLWLSLSEGGEEAVEALARQRAIIPAQGTGGGSPT